MLYYWFTTGLLLLFIQVKVAKCAIVQINGAPLEPPELVVCKTCEQDNADCPENMLSEYCFLLNTDHPNIISLKYREYKAIKIVDLPELK